MLFVIKVVAKPTAMKLSERGSGRLFGGAANIHPKIGSVGMIANAAIVISYAKKAWALSGRMMSKSGRRMIICWVSTIPQTEFSKEEIPSWNIIGPI